MQLEIVRKGDPVLRRQARVVKKVTKATLKLIKDMAETMYEANGYGLAAPQVGVSRQIVVLDDGSGLLSLVNPRITDSSGRDIDVEGCLSIPGVTGYVPRAAQVTVEYMDERGKPQRIQAEGLLARILQHEIDHLRGILFIDRATSVFEEEA